MIRYCISGIHARCSPFAHRALAPHMARHFTRVARPDQAEVFVFAHPHDLRDAPEAIIAHWRRHKTPLVIVSEEPFWDTVWGPAPDQRDVIIDTHFGAVPVVQLLHSTDPALDPGRLPYFILTDMRFESAYRAAFARNAALSPEEWTQRFAARPWDLAFMFERRRGEELARAWPALDLFGLCDWRTRLAELCQGEGTRLFGTGWGDASRFDLEDWHSAKLSALDGAYRGIGAIENTHLPNYVTEKLFDAFACGALPAYVAGPTHWVHRLGLPDAAWINLYDLSPEEAAKLLRQRVQTLDSRAYAAAQSQINAHLHDPQTWEEARARVAERLFAALRAVLG